MTADRVPSLHRLARSWGHLISAAYLADDFEADAASGFRLLDLDDGRKPVPYLEQLTLSVVEDRGYRWPRNRFPFNLLRNIAVANAPSDYVVLVDVDFIVHPPRRPGPNGCSACHAAARLRRWLPMMRLTPHLALVIPAFDSSERTPGAQEALSSIATKRALARLFRRGSAEVFAVHQYPLGHACDNASRWLSSSEPFLTPYSFGCEPYVLYNRRSAPKLWEMFVAYGKDRVSFTYELTARGFVFVVQPEAFVVHHRTPAPERKGPKSSANLVTGRAGGSSGISNGGESRRSSTNAYGHAPEAWMVGETCWPDFENRVRIKYNFREGWCLQTSIGHAVNTSIVNGSIMCIPQVENLCVLNCRPTFVVWHGKVVRALRMQAALGNASSLDLGEGDGSEGRQLSRLHLPDASASVGDADGGISGGSRGSGGADRGSRGKRARRGGSRKDGPGASGRIEASAVPVRVEGTRSRPPKQAAAFVYPVTRRDADRRRCCRTAPVLSQCESSEL